MRAPRHTTPQKLSIFSNILSSFLDYLSHECFVWGYYYYYYSEEEAEERLLQNIKYIYMGISLTVNVSDFVVSIKNTNDIYIIYIPYK